MFTEAGSVIISIFISHETNFILIIIFFSFVASFTQSPSALGNGVATYILWYHNFVPLFHIAIFAQPPPLELVLILVAIHTKFLNVFGVETIFS